MTEIEIIQKKWLALAPWKREVLKFVAQFVVVFVLYKILRYTDRHHYLTVGVVGLVVSGQALWRKNRINILKLLHLREFPPMAHKNLNEGMSPATDALVLPTSLGEQGVSRDVTP